ncbi:MAG: type II secretion system F family protein [Pseudomonadota bacterium]|nr:type II secretion system F family protein [Pseudomonadota bacterium]
MATFFYRGIDESGVKVSGTMEADSLEMAESILLSRGYIPSRVAAVTAGGGGGSFWSRINEALSKVKTSDLILFTKQFRSMMQAGVPVLRLLQVLENQTQNKTLRKVVLEVSGDIRAGSTLHNAMKKHPAIFSPLYLSMINAGEVSGTIPEILGRLTDIIEHEAKIREDIKSALQYPFIVLIALGIAFFVLLTMVVPKFVVIFQKAGVALPLPTKICMILYSAIANWWHLLLIVVVGVVIGLRFYLKTPLGRLTLDSLLLRLPLFGPLFQKAAMSRFASIFAILQASGVPVMRAMEVLSATIGNSAISREFDRVRERVQEGQGIAGPLGAAKHFTPMVVDMVAIGEESGNIEDMLRQISIHYDDEVGYAVKRLSDAIGPILMVGLAGVVGFFAMAIFMPMWDLTKMAK